MLLLLMASILEILPMAASGAIGLDITLYSSINFSVFEISVRMFCLSLPVSITLLIDFEFRIQDNPKIGC